MQVQINFTAESATDLQKLQVILASFANVTAMEQSADASGSTSAAEEKPTKRSKKTKEEAVNAPAATTPTFDFESGNEDNAFDLDNFADTSTIDLEAIRELVNGKATAGFADKIRQIMGSFAIAKLSELKPAQYATFHKSISALK